MWIRPGCFLRACGSWSRWPNGAQNAGLDSASSGFGAGTRADLVTHLADLGFAPRAVEDGIVLRACPVGAAVSAAPGLVCRMHLGAIRRLLPGEPHVELIPDGHPEGCLVRLDPESRPA